MHQTKAQQNGYNILCSLNNTTPVKKLHHTTPHHRGNYPVVVFMFACVSLTAVATLCLRVWPLNVYLEANKIKPHQPTTYLYTGQANTAIYIYIQVYIYIYIHTHNIQCVCPQNVSQVLAGDSTRVYANTCE